MTRTLRLALILAIVSAAAVVLFRLREFPRDLVNFDTNALKYRFEELDRPIIWRSIHLPNDYVSAIYDLDTLQQFDRKEEQRNIDQIDILILALDNWESANHSEYMKRFNIPPSEVLDTDPEAQLKVLTLNWTNDNATSGQTTLLVLNMSAVAQMPLRCGTLMIFEAINHIEDALDLAPWASNSGVSACLKNAKGQTD